MADTAFWISLHEYMNGAGSPAASVVYGSPAVVLGTIAAAGSTDEAIRRDSTIIAFDATVPATQAFGDSAATGSTAVAARRDHKHAMPTTPVISISKTGSTALTGAVTLTGGTNVTLTQVGQDISIAATGSSGVTYGAPALVLGTIAANGSIDEAIRRDSTIVAFDVTVPVMQAFGDSAATGSAAVAARRDHKHAMPANPFTGASAGGALDGTYPNPGLAASVAGAGLAETSDILSVNVDGTTIEINTDTLRVKAGGIGANEIASTAVTPSTYGDATHVGQFTVDADGRLTAASAVAITPAAAAAGTSQLVYRYTVTGSDKANIDTGVDTADAGSNNWTNGDLLEVFLYGRTDEAVTRSVVNVIVNNDTGSVYDLTFVEVSGTSSAFGNTRTAAQWQWDFPGANTATNNFGNIEMRIPNFMSTVGDKQGTYSMGFADATSAVCITDTGNIRYRPTTPAALSRLKIVPNTALKKFKVGTQLLIYKRTAS